MKSPIFIFSLPRSGSTLLQRVLMSNKEISSIAEPWILLPHLYTQKDKGLLAEYSTTHAVSAIDDFVKLMPNGKNDYIIELNNFLSNLYEKHCTNKEKYFLDKTPRYYHIIDEIAQVFPEAKFIFLFRNPIHVMSSILQTWSNGNFRSLYHFDNDLNIGPELLSKGYELLREKSYAVKYEDFIMNPQFYTKEICEYLEIDFSSDMVKNFTQQDTKGRMGDPTGSKTYKTITQATLTKWENTFNSSFRKLQAKKYIKSLDESLLSVQGYNKSHIIDSINEIKTKSLFSFRDFIHVIIWKLTVRFHLNIFYGAKTSKWTRGKWLS